MKRILLATASVAALGSTLSGPAAAQQCDPDFSGVELTAGTQVGPYIASALRMAAESWSKQTCGTVDVVEFPFGELVPKFTTAMSQGDPTFDVITMAPAWTPDLAPYLSPVPDEILQGPEWEDIHPVYRDRLMVWNGDHMTMTMDGDLHALSYRTDLFNDPEEQAAFREKYGYDLAPPESWDQYYDIAEFFTRPDQNLYGTAEAFRRGGQQFWFFFTHGASYTNHPDAPGCMFFNPETMEAEINNPGWVRALEDYIRSVQYSPPGALNYDSGAIRTAFASGLVAMNFDWGDTGVVAADPEQSQVSGHVGSAIIPGSTEIYNCLTDEWTTYEQPVRSPFMAYGGWQAAVPNTSDNIEAAWNFVEHLTSAEESGQAVITGGSGVNPYRLSHFENVDLWLSIFSPEEAQMYLDAQRGSLDAENVALDMRLPGYFSYTEALEIELSRALAGEIPPQEALDNIAEQWNALTEEFGRDEQLAAYRSSMGLPAQE